MNGDAVAEWLGRRASTHRDRTAVAFRGEELTFGELERRVGVAAAVLRGSGILAGDSVALLARNGLETVVAVHAIARAGAVLVPLNTRLTPAELSWQLRDSGSVALLHDDANANPAAIAAARAGGQTVLELPRLSSCLTDAGSLPPQTLCLDRIQGIVYTSGTTGNPKGAQLTFGNWWSGASASALHLGHDPADRWLAALPLFHVGGLAILFRSVIAGAPVTLMDGFDGEEAVAAIARDRVTLVSLVAPTLARLLEAARSPRALGSLRVALLGGGPAAPSLVEEAVVRGVPVAPTYGLTEAGSQVATLPPGQAARVPGCVGWALPHVEMCIARDGVSLPAGAEGEIAVRGLGLMRGYRGSELIAPGAWFPTGDMGRLDEDGRLYVLDRRDDLIVSGGENVYPAEVEAALARSSDIVEAVVVGVPDETWGHVPVAFVVVRSGATLDAAKVLAEVSELLAPYKRPRRIVAVAELPRNASGKVVRRTLRDRLTT